jgi:hypothetical protein
VAHPKWLEQALIHEDITRRSDKERAGHIVYTDPEARQAIIHIRNDLAMALSLLTTICRFLSLILFTSRVAIGVFAACALWHFIH